MRELERALGTTLPDAGIAGLAREERLLLVVDQFEELFTTCADDEERSAFVQVLTDAAERPDGPVSVVVAIRADYYGRCAAFPALAELLSANHLLVGPMEPDELRRAIRLPAERVGLTVEPELVDALVAEVTDEPGGLPLLSTTLLSSGCSAGRTLTFASYRESGGVHGAVARLAEDAYDRLTERQRAVARAILLRSAGPGTGAEAVRRPRAARRAGREERPGRRRRPRDPHGCAAAHGHRDDGRGRAQPFCASGRGYDRGSRTPRGAASICIWRRPWAIGWRADAISGPVPGSAAGGALDWTAGACARAERGRAGVPRGEPRRRGARRRAAAPNNRRLRGLGRDGVVPLIALIAGSLALVQGGRAERASRIANARSSHLGCAREPRRRSGAERAPGGGSRQSDEVRRRDRGPGSELALHEALVGQRAVRSIPGMNNFDYSPDGRLLVDTPIRRVVSRPMRRSSIPRHEKSWRRFLGVMARWATSRSGCRLEPTRRPGGDGKRSTAR